MKKNQIGIILTLIALVAIVYFAVNYVDIPKTAEILSRADISLLVLALGLETIALVLKTLKWKILIAPKLSNNINFSELFKIQVAGIAISNITPARIGETTKCLYMEKYGLKKRFTLLTILWERLFDVIAILLFSAFIVSSYGSIVTVVLVLTILAAFVAYNLDKLAVFFSKLPRLGFLSELTFHKFSKTTLLKSFVVGLIAWTFDLLAVAVAFQATGVNLAYVQIMGAYAVSLIVGLISTIPGGFGSLEGSLYILLKGTYPVATLVAAFITARLVTIGWVFVLGALAMMTMKKK
ncbi:MAG: lysylphosphatidylglycerol synthase transmembrane domain-containing protein [Candidatus Micrarchaeota archaeon]